MSDAPSAAPPWTCRLRAVVRLGLRGGTLGALSVVSYAETPVGPYGEALLAQLRLPLRVTVPWIVVDSEPSARAGREHWGLPKELARLELDLDGSSRVRAPAGVLEVAARPLGPSLPVVGRAVLDQPGRGPARLRFRGRARPAAVRVSGSPCARGWPASGTGLGLVLDGVLRLGPGTSPRPGAVRSLRG